MKKTGKTQAKKKPTAANGWAALTWDDLDLWAGSRTATRRRDYERQGYVETV